MSVGMLQISPLSLLRAEFKVLWARNDVSSEHYLKTRVLKSHSILSDGMLNDSSPHMKLWFTAPTVSHGYFHCLVQSFFFFFWKRGTAALSISTQFPLYNRFTSSRWVWPFHLRHQLWWPSRGKPYCASSCKQPDEYYLYLYHLLPFFHGSQARTALSSIWQPLYYISWPLVSQLFQLGVWVWF